MQQEQFYNQAGATSANQAMADVPPDMPQCCGTGCTVCVLDYPELFAQTPAEAQTLAMLEAIEQAQFEASRLLAETNGELQ